MKGPPALGPIVGESMAIRRVRELIDRYAPTGFAILIVGATGTGKELVARHIHAGSGRRGRFVPVNCGALPREMAEGLLFGYERGAFSGAVKDHRGHIECADGGTLFLDELFSLSLEGQAKLLRALDSGEIQRLGAESERYIDARVVAAMQEDVAGRIRGGWFRRDLYQRLAGVTLELPPLVDRQEDVIPLAQHFAQERGRVLEQGTKRLLLKQTWPGNVRELRQVIERAGCLAQDGTIPAAALAQALSMAPPPSGASNVRTTWPTRDDLLRVCVANSWNVAQVAAAFGVRRTQLYERLRAAGTSLRDLKMSGLSGGSPAGRTERSTDVFS